MPGSTVSIQGYNRNTPSRVGQSWYLLLSLLLLPTIGFSKKQKLIYTQRTEQLQAPPELVIAIYVTRPVVTFLWTS
jgi:hypothetical protein